MKKSVKILIIVLSALLSVVLVTGGLGWCVFGSNIKAALSVKKLSDNLYYMEYEGDYGFSDFLEGGGAASEKEMANFIIEKMSGGFYKPQAEDVSLDFGCSALSVKGEDYSLMGRNYDWEGSSGNAMIIHTKPSEGYESYSTTWLDFLGFGEGFAPEEFTQKYLSIAAVYVPLDGINEKGLCVADLIAGDNEVTKQNTEKGDLTTTSAIRLVLAILTGIGIGIPVTIICMISIGGFNEIIKEFLVWTCASALFGVLSVVTFKSERLNLILSTVIHCVGCLLITVGACAIIGYSNNFFEILLSVAPVFIIVYAVIYGVSLISMKINARKANEALEKK